MQVLQVDKKLLKTFVRFPDVLYRGDDNYVPYVEADLTKTLKKLLFCDGTYTALLVCEGKNALARVLFTVSKNKQLFTEKCGFFCMFECVNDQAVCNLLFGEMRRLLKLQGAEYISGNYFPFDPDNRRGVLCRGFDRAPLIFTSYNKPYYNDLLLGCGLQKQVDAYQYQMDLDRADYARIARIAEFSERRFDFRVDKIDFGNIERDIRDFHTVMEISSNEIIYQEAPSVDELRSIVKQWRAYLERDFILIARSNKDDSPIGAVMALPDFFQVIRKMRGKTDLKGLLTFLRERKKIKSMRAIMQYVAPAYQNKGVIVALYNEMNKSVQKHGINYVEAGTIMEKNAASNSAIAAVGGKLARIYRIYFAELK